MDYATDTIPLYTEIIQSPKRSPDFKMLIISGDVDGICATVGTQSWIYSVINDQSTNLSSPGLSSVYTMWRPYFVAGQQAGYITQFHDSLTFATVHSAGHEVPLYQPRRAYYLFKMFVNGSIFHFDSVSSASTSPSTWSQYTLWISVTSAFIITVMIVVYFKSSIQNFMRPRSREYNLVETRERGGTSYAQDDDEVEVQFNPLSLASAPDSEEIDQIRV